MRQHAHTKKGLTCTHNNTATKSEMGEAKRSTYKPVGLSKKYCPDFANNPCTVCVPNILPGEEKKKACIKRKIRTRLDLLSIPQSGGGGMSKRLGGIKGCKNKTSWHLNGFPDGNFIPTKQNETKNKNGHSKKLKPGAGKRSGPYEQRP